MPGADVRLIVITRGDLFGDPAARLAPLGIQGRVDSSEVVFDGSVD